MDRYCRGAETGPRAGEGAHVPEWIVGRSPSFLDTLARVARLASHDVPVLIEGETGAGKEVVVRLLHYLSRRAGRPFVPVNAGAIADGLFENELFGHAAGAYTDAKARVKGLVEIAEGGTLFLDEIDALSGHGQVALLRFLQDGSYRPVGTGRDLTADVRVVAATNADLDSLLRAGSFRRDLYYRLSGVTVRIPPLRERAADVLPLAEHFLAECNARPGATVRTIGPELAGWLLAQSWPGNVRELRSVIENRFIMCDHEVLTPPGRPPTDAAATSPAGLSDAKARLISAFERHYLDRLMSRCEGNVSRAAASAGKERKTFSRLLRKYGIEREAFTRPQASDRSGEDRAPEALALP
ncbi:MAG TPA: sigma-54 dependent transcriptional regulator [Allosphingosinicella sp.]|nr:sigma-54 dependent transcriptional regulator [Allosphingosinicella sp.]